MFYFLTLFFPLKTLNLTKKNNFVQEELMIVYTEACVCVTLHDCKVEKHTSLQIYEQAEGGVNQAHGPAVSWRRHTTVYTFL